MASAAEISRFKNRSSVAAVTLPVPVFSLSALPSKIARIDPVGAKTWLQENNAAITDWINAQNTSNPEISAAPVKSP